MCRSCRSRKKLKNEPTLAFKGVRTSLCDTGTGKSISLHGTCGERFTGIIGNLLMVMGNKDQGYATYPGLRIWSLIFDICTPESGDEQIQQYIRRAHSRPYRSRLLRANTHFVVLLEIYKIYALFNRSKLNIFSREMIIFSPTCWPDLCQHNDLPSLINCWLQVGQLFTNV